MPPLGASSSVIRTPRSCSACPGSAGFLLLQEPGEAWRPITRDFMSKTSVHRKSTRSNCNFAEIFDPHSTYHYLAPATMPNADLAIRLEHVCRYYTMGESSVRAVDDVSLAIPEGQF